MPEGVEVSLFSRSLTEFLQQKTITKVEVLSGRYTKKPIEGLELLQNNLPLVVDEINNKGKFLYWTFKNSDIILFNTLGMTGGWTSRSINHSRVKFSLLDANDQNDQLFFIDIRNFGTLNIKTKKDLDSKLKSIGFDIVQNDLPYLDFYNLLYEYKNMNVCELLMRQDVLSGVGNYIKAEALWFANIHPLSMIKDLDYQDISLLYDGLKNVIARSFDAGGATIKNYFRFNNWERTINFFQVYGKSFDDEGNKVEKMETPDKRTTHWSPTKQIRGFK